MVAGARITVLFNTVPYRMIWRTGDFYVYELVSLQKNGGKDQNRRIIQYGAISHDMANW